MKNRILLYALAMLVFSTTACSFDSSEGSGTEVTLKSTELRGDNGAVQFEGVGMFPEATECLELNGAFFAAKLTGDLEGCLYVFVEEYECSPSGTYRERGMEYFVGTYKGEAGTFETNYHFTSKYEDCSEEGFPLGAEIFGRCQHPIAEGSGTGVFEGVSGRIDFKDDVVNLLFPYRGHLRY